jgi:hypothetical protein
MKLGTLVCVVMTSLVLVGCESPPRTSEVTLRAGMSRDDLRLHFGEPLRIEPGPSGAENWYYRFVAWRTSPVGESGTSIESGQVTSYVSGGLEFSKDPEECPIHLSPDGYVIEPLPIGKVVRN